MPGWYLASFSYLLCICIQQAFYKRTYYLHVPRSRPALFDAARVHAPRAGAVYVPAGAHMDGHARRRRRRRAGSSQQASGADTAGRAHAYTWQLARTRGTARQTTAERAGARRRSGGGRDGGVRCEEAERERETDREASSARSAWLLLLYCSYVRHRRRDSFSWLGHM